MKIKEDISKCYDINGNLNFNKIPKSLLAIIEASTSFLDIYSPKIQERVYCILHDITSIIICPITKKKLRFSPQTKQYSSTREFSQANKLKRPVNHKDRMSKDLDLVFEKYKRLDYNLLDRSECLSIFDTLSPNTNSRITGTIAKTHIDFVCSCLYYTKFLGESDLRISERCYCIRNNILEHPVDHNGLNLKYINRFEGYSKFSSKTNSYQFYIDAAQAEISKKFVVNGYVKELNSGTTKRLNVTCKSCNHTFTPFFKNALWKKIYCPGCNGLVGRSRLESEVVEYLKSLGVTNIIENDRQILNGLEIDIYLPEFNIGIEMCGILWHSFGSKYPRNDYLESLNKYKHQEKYDKCKDKDISLLTIFENEWNLKQAIVKSIISNKLKISTNRIFARKCVCNLVSKNVADTFLEENHIQGRCNYSEAFGLFYNGELVSLMCFGKRKLTRGESQEELVRFCNKINTSVVGGASKILKFSKKCNFTSYCDLRYGSGNLYIKLGMTLIRTTKPNYYYTLDKIHLLHRMNFQKHKIWDGETPQTESQIMYSKGYRKIYDCGNLVFQSVNTK